MTSVLFLSLAFFFGLVFAVIGSSQADYFTSAKKIMFLFVILLLFSAGIISLKNLILGLPRLTLTEEGIELSEGWGKKRFWMWKEVGPFRYATMRIRYNTIHYLCAFYDITHDSFQKLGEVKSPDLLKADITLQINAFKGFGAKLLIDMEAEINRCREQYGSPGDDAGHLSLAELQQRTTKVKRKGTIQGILFFIITVGGAFLTAYCKAKN